MHPGSARTPRKRLYTEDERARPDSTRWTLVPGLLAPAPFVAFPVSVVPVLRLMLPGYCPTGLSYTLVPVGGLLRCGFCY